MATKNSLSSGLSWILMLAAAATAGGAAAALLSRQRTQRRIAHLDHKAHVKSWENEGGNV